MKEGSRMKFYGFPQVTKDDRYDRIQDGIVARCPGKNCRSTIKVFLAVGEIDQVKKPDC